MVGYFGGTIAPFLPLVQACAALFLQGVAQRRRAFSSRDRDDLRLEMTANIKMATSTIMAGGIISDGWSVAIGFATSNCKVAKVPLDRPPAVLHVPGLPPQPEASMATPNPGEMGAPACPPRIATDQTHPDRFSTLCAGTPAMNRTGLLAAENVTRFLDSLSPEQRMMFEQLASPGVASPVPPVPRECNASTPTFIAERPRPRVLLILYVNYELTFLGLSINRQYLKYSSSRSTRVATSLCKLVTTRAQISIRHFNEAHTGSYLGG